MKKKIRIFIILLLIISLGVLLGIIDYNRIKSGSKPIFMIRITDGGAIKQEYIGLFYRMERSVGVSYKEELYQDNNIKFGFWFYVKDILVGSPVVDYSYKIETNEMSICNNPKLYYSDGTKKIYTYCLNNILINYPDKNVELKDVIEINPNIINEIIDLLIPKGSLLDGGTSIYKDSGNTGFTNNGITVVKCNTLSGNQDIYIGPISLEVDNNLCKTNIISYVKTYKLISINNGEEENSYYLTLQLFQGEIDTVLVRNFNYKLEVDKTYEFYFEREYNSQINDDIKSIFANSSIKNIKETDLVGLSQTQNGVN